jgi:hypothetical protein
VNEDRATDDAIAALRAAQLAYDEDGTEEAGLREQAIRDAHAAGASRQAIAAIVGSVVADEVLG